jgi:L-amino acid N-acyltransferase YncA
VPGSDDPFASPPTAGVPASSCGRVCSRLPFKSSRKPLAAAIALYEKHGFRREGLLERFAYRDGAYVDAFTMARLR